MKHNGECGGSKECINLCYKLVTEYKECIYKQLFITLKWIGQTVHVYSFEILFHFQIHYEHVNEIGLGK